MPLKRFSIAAAAALTAGAVLAGCRSAPGGTAGARLSPASIQAQGVISPIDQRVARQTTAWGWTAPDHYTGPLPRRAPELVPGQQFLCARAVDDTGLAYDAAPQFRDASTGQSIPGLHLALRVLTLEHVQPRPGAPAQLEFLVEGTQRRVTLQSSADVRHMPDLIPLVSDAQLDALRHRYEGRRAWFYGGHYSDAATDSAAYWAGVDAPFYAPVRIRRIVRVDIDGVLIAVGGVMDQIDADAQNVITDDRPLLVIIDSPASTYSLKLPLRDASPPVMFPGRLVPPPAIETVFKRLPRPPVITRGFMRGFTGAPPGLDRILADERGHAPQSVVGHVMGEYLVVSDAWDIQRLVTLRPPARRYPAWWKRTSRNGNAAANDGIAIGMTRDMVAWNRGYGNGIGTLRQIRRARSWTYDGLPNFETVTFDARGRVASVTRPTLP